MDTTITVSHSSTLHRQTLPHKQTHTKTHRDTHELHNTRRRRKKRRAYIYIHTNDLETTQGSLHLLLLLLLLLPSMVYYYYYIIFFFVFFFCCCCLCFGSWVFVSFSLLCFGSWVVSGVFAHTFQNINEVAHGEEDDKETAMKEEEQVEALHKELRKEVASADCIAANSNTPPPLPFSHHLAPLPLLLFPFYPFPQFLS
jgi:hypothetical protein